jgi:hypothetical protein
MARIKFPMLILEREEDNMLFLAFLLLNGIKPVRADLLTKQSGPYTIVLHDDDANKVREWMKVKNVPFTEMPIIIEQG